MSYKRSTRYNEYSHNAEVYACSIGKDIYYDGVDIVNNKSSIIAQETIDKLAELEDKIENRTLVELPCRVGDIVYVTYGIAIERWEVASIQIYSFDILLRLGHSGTDDYNSQYISELGEHLFLTKEQAEAKLKELQSKE